MQGTGQEEYTHACSACFLVSEDEYGHKSMCQFIYVTFILSLKYYPAKVHPAVCDGVTIGHPCCMVHG